MNTRPANMNLMQLNQARPTFSAKPVQANCFGSNPASVTDTANTDSSKTEHNTKPAPPVAKPLERSWLFTLSHPVITGLTAILKSIGLDFIARPIEQLYANRLNRLALNTLLKDSQQTARARGYWEYAKPYVDNSHKWITEKLGSEIRVHPAHTFKEIQPQLLIELFPNLTLSLNFIAAAVALGEIETAKKVFETIKDIDPCLQQGLQEQAQRIRAKNPLIAGELCQITGITLEKLDQQIAQNKRDQDNFNQVNGICAVCDDVIRAAQENAAPSNTVDETKKQLEAILKQVEPLRNWHHSYKANAYFAVALVYLSLDKPKKDESQKPSSKPEAESAEETAKTTATQPNQASTENTQAETETSKADVKAKSKKEKVLTNNDIAAEWLNNAVALDSTIYYRIRNFIESTDLRLTAPKTVQNLRTVVEERFKEVTLPEQPRMTSESLNVTANIIEQATTNNSEDPFWTDDDSKEVN